MGIFCVVTIQNQMVILIAYIMIDNIMCVYDKNVYCALLMTIKIIYL